jgi:hypothetical protein
MFYLCRSMNHHFLEWPLHLKMWAGHTLFHVNGAYTLRVPFVKTLSLSCVDTLSLSTPSPRQQRCLPQRQSKQEDALKGFFTHDFRNRPPTLTAKERVQSRGRLATVAKRLPKRHWPTMIHIQETAPAQMRESN